MPRPHCPERSRSAQVGSPPGGPGNRQRRTLQPATGARHGKVQRRRDDQNDHDRLTALSTQGKEAACDEYDRTVGSDQTETEEDILFGQGRPHSVHRASSPPFECPRGRYRRPPALPVDSAGLIINLVLPTSVPPHVILRVKTGRPTRPTKASPHCPSVHIDLFYWYLTLGNRRFFASKAAPRGCGSPGAGCAVAVTSAPFRRGAPRRSTGRYEITGDQRGCLCPLLSTRPTLRVLANDHTAKRCRGRVILKNPLCRDTTWIASHNSTARGPVGAGAITGPLKPCGGSERTTMAGV